MRVYLPKSIQTKTIIRKSLNKWLHERQGVFFLHRARNSHVLTTVGTLALLYDLRMFTQSASWLVEKKKKEQEKLELCLFYP